MQPYNDKEPKKEQVQRMFDRIAPRYDLLNRTLSLGTDRVWRRKLVRTVRRDGRRAVLDVATGTGDLAFAIAYKCPGAVVTGFDLSAGMLEVARRRAERSGLVRGSGNAGDQTGRERDRDMGIAGGCLEEGPITGRGEAGHTDPGKGKNNSRDILPIDFIQGEAEAMPFADGSFDAVTCAFGVRNFHDLEAGLSEMARVLADGGRVYILEFSAPRSKLFGAVYKWYFHRVLPRIGGLVSRDGSAYKYLPGSVDEFPAPELFLEMMSGAGFAGCRYRRLTNGVACLYTGTVARG